MAKRLIEKNHIKVRICVPCTSHLYKRNQPLSKPCSNKMFQILLNVSHKINIKSLIKNNCLENRSEVFLGKVPYAKKNQ